ncbi:MAG: ankyrin repeat domain-containing protein, partial [Thiovulaceae bacterium]|nr:ankyrin repeat domain-containing protein [Sulfurimonadaceae bacterium]
MKSIKLFLATTSLAFLIAFLGGCGKQADFAFDYDPYEKEKILFKLFTEQAVYEMGDDQTFRISQNRYLIYDDVSVAPVRYGMIRLEKGKVHLTNFNKDPFFTLSIDENDQVLLRSKKQTILLKPDFTEIFYQPQNIFEAIKWGDMKDVDRLVLTGESLDDANALGMYPLMTAIYYDNYPIIQYLVLAGVDLLAQNYSSMTALHIALKEKNKEVIQLLLANGAKEQFYPCKELMPVLPKDDFSIVKLMVDAGFDPSCQESTILFSLLSQKKMEGSKQLENLNYLLSKQINTNVNALEGGDTPLMRAAAYGNAAMVQRLIDHGVDLFSEDKKGQTALDYVNLYTSNADQNIDAILKAAGLNTGIKAKADQEYSNAMKLLHQGRALEAYWKMVDLSNTYKQKRFYLARIKAGMQIEKPTLRILKDLVTMYDRFHEKKSYTSY